MGEKLALKLDGKFSMVCRVTGEWEAGYLLRPGHLQRNGDELEREISFNLLSLFLGVGVEGAWDKGRGML